MKLTPKQISELSKLDAPPHVALWGGVPPEKADPDLRLYIQHGWVKWTGRGYRITDAGHMALEQARGEAKG